MPGVWSRSWLTSSLPRKPHLPTPWANLASNLGIGKLQLGTLSSKYYWQESGPNWVLHKSGWQQFLLLPFTKRNLSRSCCLYQTQPSWEPSCRRTKPGYGSHLNGSKLQVDRCSSEYMSKQNLQVPKEPPGQNKEALGELGHLHGSGVHLPGFPAVPMVLGGTIPFGS